MLTLFEGRTRRSGGTGGDCFGGRRRRNNSIATSVCTSSFHPLSSFSLSLSSQLPVFFYHTLMHHIRPDDSTFTAPLLNAELKPKRGDVVTFSYKAFSRRATPVDPKVLRVRLDLNWEDVLREHVREQALNGSPYSPLTSTPSIFLISLPPFLFSFVLSNFSAFSYLYIIRFYQQSPALLAKTDRVLE